FLMSPSSVSWTVRSSSCITGSRLLFWLHALVSAFTERGYWSGVVIAFSIRQPITRISVGESCKFMESEYDRTRKFGTRSCHNGCVLMRIGFEHMKPAPTSAADVRG